MAKPRVLISTDIGGSDPDDIQSMVHALLYADKVNLVGLVSTPTKHGGRASDIHKVVDAYAKDYGNLKTWSSDYPTPAYLKGIISQGNINVAPSKGWASPSEGSKAIIKAAHASSEPLWVLTWGSMTDVAQALHDDPSIAGKIKVYSLGAWNTQQDPAARNYVYNNFKDLWWIESNTTMRGMYVNDQGLEKNAWKMADAVGHGALGDHFYAARPYGLKMGDTPSLLYLLDGANDLNPAASSWGGSFVKNGHGPNYWTDNPSSALKNGWYNGSETVQKYQAAIYKDFVMRLDRADKPNSNASNGDKAVDAINDAAGTAAGKAVKIDVLDNDKAPDGGLKIAGFDVASAKGGKIALNTDGTLTYTPKAGYVGNDSFAYKARDVDGDIDTASVSIKVQAAVAGAPPASVVVPPTISKPGNPGSGRPVEAVDDSYKMDAGKTLWFNTKYLTWNDKGADGGLKVVALDKVSENGVSVSWAANGTAVYKAPAGFNGTDRLGYTLSDKNGSTDTASVEFVIGKATATPPAAKPSAPSKETVASNTGSGHPVVAVDDARSVKAGETYYFNTRHLMHNDKGRDGGLDVLKLDSVSKAGVTIPWGPEGSAKDGTAIYKAKPGWQGVDSVNYTLTDRDGSTDTGTLYLMVGKNPSGHAWNPTDFLFS